MVQASLGTCDQLSGPMALDMGRPWRSEVGWADESADESADGRDVSFFAPICCNFSFFVRRLFLDHFHFSDENPSPCNGSSQQLTFPNFGRPGRGTEGSSSNFQGFVHAHNVDSCPALWQ